MMGWGGKRKHNDCFILRLSFYRYDYTKACLCTVLERIVEGRTFTVLHGKNKGREEKGSTQQIGLLLDLDDTHIVIVINHTQMVRVSPLSLSSSHIHVCSMDSSQRDYNEEKDTMN